MLGPKFTEKIYDFIISHDGADMVDAWMLVNVCSKGDERATKGGRKNRLNCYHVQQGAKPPHVIGGYLPEWYGTDRTARDTDNWAEWLRNEKNARVYDAARGERMEAWRNGAERGKFGRANDRRALGEKRRVGRDAPRKPPPGPRRRRARRNSPRERQRASRRVCRLLAIPHAPFVVSRRRGGFRPLANRSRFHRQTDARASSSSSAPTSRPNEATETTSRETNARIRASTRRRAR